MDLEELKKQWASLSTRIDNLESTINTQKLNKMKTSQEFLVSRYRRFSIIAAVFVFLTPVIMDNLTDNILLSAAFSLYFLTSAVMDFVLQRKVSEIDIASMPVAEVSQLALRTRRLHHIFQIIIMIFMIVLLASLVINFLDDKYSLIGIAAGGAIGIIVGLRLYFKIMDNYKALIR